MTASLIERLRASMERRAYRRAMLRAIADATEPSEIWGPCSRTDGLRAIRAFERLNGHPFDPYNPVCRAVVRGTGPKHRRALIRRVAAHSSQGE